jgi:hypothetical protein
MRSLYLVATRHKEFFGFAAVLWAAAVYGFGLGVLVPGQGYAADGFTGQSLYTLCNLKDKVSETGCETWIAGFFAGYHFARMLTADQRKEATTCPPEGISGEQARLIIEKFMRNNPQVLHFSADAVAASAIDQAFSCDR